MQGHSTIILVDIPGSWGRQLRSGQSGMPGIISEVPFASPQPDHQSFTGPDHTVFWVHGAPEAGGGAYNSRNGLTPSIASERPAPMLISITGSRLIC